MRRFFALLPLFFALAFRSHAQVTKPVWLLGNNFHTSLVFRASDIPFRREITGSPDAGELALGWGAAADYRGPSTWWTVVEAIFPNRAAIHVVPIHGPITRRFPHSDVVQINLDASTFSKLISEIDRSFLFTPDHHRVYLGRGFYPDSRFYSSSEHFYFPYVCNEWVALKLTHAGVPFRLSRALFSNSLILQAAKKGRLLQRHGKPRDDY